MRQIVAVTSVFAAVAWCSLRLLDFATCLFNRHVVIIAIIMLLFVLHRHSDGGASAADLYDDPFRYSEAARVPPPPEQSEEAPPPPAEIGDGGCEKQMVADECDDVAKVIERAARQMKKCKRNRSEMTLRREVAVRPELWRSEAENPEEAEIDAFIEEHWFKRKPKLERRRIPGDGRCLFRSVVHGACLRAGKPSPNESRGKELADELRAAVEISSF